MRKKRKYDPVKDGPSNQPHYFWDKVTDWRASLSEIAAQAGGPSRERCRQMKVKMGVKANPMHKPKRSKR